MTGLGAAVPIPALPPTLLFEELSEAAYFRICSKDYGASEPSFRTGGDYRFDAPDGSYNTLYCARNFTTCFFETVVRDNDYTQLSRAVFDNKMAVLLLLDLSELRLVQMYGKGAQLAGQNMSVLTGEDYDKTQALSKAIHEHASAPDGIVYRSRYDDTSTAVVLFERARPRVRFYPGTEPIPFNDVSELTQAVRNVIPYVLI